MSNAAWWSSEAARLEVETKRLQGENRRLRAGIKALRGLLHIIAFKGHHTGYDWNADPDGLTELEREVEHVAEAALAGETGG